MTLDDKIRIVKGDGLSHGRSVDELALGYLRYEALRKLSARRYAALCKRNIQGERFDTMVDELVLKTP